MHGKRRRWVLVAVLLVLLAAIGVVVWQMGDDDDAPSQREFAEQANEICRETEQSLENVAQGAETPEEIADAVDRVIGESRDVVDELADLERPEGEAGERAQDFVDATRRELQEVGIPALEQLREALESRDREAAQEAAVRLQQLDSDASNKAARALGANACA
jgi:hypothetical protein